MKPHQAAGIRLFSILAALLLAGPAGAREPQPTLPEVALRINGTALQAEIADEPAERTAGLMGRTELADGRGMLFVFPRPQPLSFWMRDTLIPLSIAYINAAGVIREIHALKPHEERPVFSTVRDLSYALEVPLGWFERNKILPGDKILGLPAPATAVPD
jgi:uncharacterized membrane protein (UPF0127 family)